MKKKLILIGLQSIFVIIYGIIYLLLSVFFTKCKLLLLSILVFIVIELLIYLYIYERLHKREYIIISLIDIIKIVSVFLISNYNHIYIYFIHLFLLDSLLLILIFFNRNYIISYEFYRRMLYKLPRPLGHKLLYKKVFGKKLDLKNPRTFDEKLQWLMSYKYGKNISLQTDKELVKDWVRSKKIKNLEIPKTYFLIDRKFKKEDIPKKCVLKTNHGSGVAFVFDGKKRTDADIDHAIKELKKYSKQNFAKIWLEYQYNYIKPVIMCEEYLDDGKHTNPLDYKFMCSDGKVFSILLCSNRENNLKLDMYDRNWNKLDYTKEKYRSNKEIKKPEKLKEMLKIAEELSKGYPFVRVDLYEINKKIYFGELTFTSGAGLNDYYTESFQKNMGDFIKLDVDNFK